jgi:hypothetical protein
MTMPEVWARREQEPEWHWCKYCYEQVPTFRLTEGLAGSTDVQVLRCCCECGAGLEILTRAAS